MRLITNRIRFIALLLVISPWFSLAQSTTYLPLRKNRLLRAQEAERKAVAQHDSLQLAEAYYLYGKTYAFSGDLETSQRYFMKSLAIQERRGLSFELGRLYVRLSENELQKGDIRQATLFAEKSLSIYQKIRSEQGYLRSFAMLGKISEYIWEKSGNKQEGYYLKALGYYQRLERISYKLKDRKGIAATNQLLGTLFSKAKDPRAIPYLKSAIAIFPSEELYGDEVECMLFLAAAYRNAGKYSKAHQTLAKAEKQYIFYQLNEYAIQIHLENQFILFYEQIGEWKKANVRLRRLKGLERKLLLADREGAISRLHLEYETRKKEARLNTQQREIKLQAQTLHVQSRFMAAVLILLIMAAGMSSIFFWMWRRNRRMSLRNETLLKEQNHRVKNNLQLISSLLSLQAKRLKNEAVRKAIEESRLRIQAMAIVHRKLYDKEELVEVDVRTFVPEVVDGVLKVYGYNDIVVHYSIEPMFLQGDKAVSVGLILNELTTNACKYAFPEVDHPVFEIRFTVNEGYLFLDVKDNGKGWQENEPPDRSGSFGMTLIKTQVEQLYGAYTFVSYKAATILPENNTNAAKGLMFTMKFPL